MICNITNALPALLKKMKNNDNSVGLVFDLKESLKFYDSIFSNDKIGEGLKHIFLDCKFTLKDEYKSLVNTFVLSLDTVDLLNNFQYVIDNEDGSVIIRGNLESLSVISLILAGSIKALTNDIEFKNKGIFISLAQHFLTFCLNNDHHICSIEDIKNLENYNLGFEKEVIESISLIPTSERYIGTIHFVGIELNSDILCIFEKYKDIKFTYNKENASYVISMKSEYWDDYWKNAPEYLKAELETRNERKQNIS